jgi:hypothetical protein
MATLHDILLRPDWLPHEIDPSGKTMLFVRMTPEQFTAHQFLAHQDGVERQWVPIDDLLGALGADQQSGPVQFIFHSGFCRSTLLLRALCVEGKVFGLNEPEIINSLARLADPGDALIGLVFDLLSRPHAAGQTTLIKPSNFGNRLIPSIMRIRSDATAILLTGTLDEFLWAIVRKGLLGRQWGRQTYLAAATYAGEVKAFEPLIAGMTDLQVAALGWLLMQNWFAQSQRTIGASRAGVMHSAYLNTNRAKAIAAAAAHLNLGLEQAAISAILEGPVFATDAKTGADYSLKEASDAQRSRSAVIEEEIGEVSAWIDELARVSGLTAPLPQTLC